MKMLRTEVKHLRACYGNNKYDLARFKIAKDTLEFWGSLNKPDNFIKHRMLTLAICERKDYVFLRNKIDDLAEARKNSAIALKRFVDKRL